jgi:hypothetical protein
LGDHRERDMRWSFWLFVAVAGGFAQLLLLIADREIDAGVDRLAEVKFAPQNLLGAAPDLKLVSAHGPYTRNER